jgi:hypothetical protein
MISSTIRHVKTVAATALVIFMLAACATDATDVRTSEDGHFGMIVQPVNYEIAKRLGLNQPDGDLVTDVMSGGMAALAGIQIGDMIMHFDGKMIHGSSESKSDKVLIDHLQVPIGKSVEVKVLRDGKPITLALKVSGPPTDPVELLRQRNWLEKISLEEARRKEQAELDKERRWQQQLNERARQDAEDLKKENARREKCGNDLRQIRVGITLDRLKQCWRDFGRFRLSGQVNRADGVMSIYELPSYIAGSDMVYAIGVSAIYVIDGKVVGWTR